jgi:acetyl-CoA carboxylase carboxyltransferase component
MPATGTPELCPSEGHLNPEERLEGLCDAGSLEVVGARVKSSAMGGRARPGDGVIGGVGRVNGRPVACYAQDASYLGGSLGVAQASTIERVLETASRWGLPVVSFIESGGARMQEGAAALYAYGKVFRHNVHLSARVPQISIISGVAAGGGCYSPALTDFVVMVREGSMFLTGPTVVREVMGEEAGIHDLGGHRVHERNGVCHLVAAADAAAIGKARSLLSYLPQHVDGDLPLTPGVEPREADPGACVPLRSRSVYDVRDAIAGLLDAGSMLEIAPRWARSIVTSFARLDGRPVGVIASQPRFLGGVLDVESSQKGARFVELCDKFGLPLIVLVDTPGFMPGMKQESAGVIRFGATLVRAFAAATVPRVTVVLRKAYGGAFIAMNSKGLGADLVLAWPNAEIGIMAADSAIGIIHRKVLDAATDRMAERQALAAAYAEEHLGAEAAAEAGVIDEVVEPHETRRRLIGAIETASQSRL